MKPASHPTAQRTARLLVEAGFAGAQVVEFEQPTRTSAEAAAAIGCTVAEIAKLGGKAVACTGDVTAADFGDRSV